MPILESVAANDVGQANNAAAVEGQIEGGASQGYALSDGVIHREGKLMSPSCSEHVIPLPKDVPTPVLHLRGCRLCTMYNAAITAADTRLTKTS